jgi:hypothetical protein
MHFKRNLWLSMVGAIIIIAAVFFSSKNSEVNSDEQKNLPQINQLKPQKQPEFSKGLDAQSSYFKH